MKKLLFILTPLLLLGADAADTQGENTSFMTQQEYGKRLYNNPRGISCAKCHGANGQGKDLASYRHKGKDRVLKAVKINDLTLEQFKKGIEKVAYNSVMPKYYLTDDEIKVIHAYITIKK